MAKKKEVTVEERLRALYDLQLIDSRIDEIRNVRGELPLEVRDLEDEVAGLNTRFEKLEASLEVINNDINSKKNLIEEAKALIKKYNEQQKNVRNNREFNSISIRDVISSLISVILLSVRKPKYAEAPITSASIMVAANCTRLKMCFK